MQTINLLYLNRMSSLRVLQESTAQLQLQRFKLKEKLLKDELARLKIRLSNAHSISKRIKLLLPAFRHPHSAQEQRMHACCSELLRPLAQELYEMHKLLNADNDIFGG